MNSTDKNNNLYSINLNILFDNKIDTNILTFNLIVQLLDVSFEDVIDNIVYEIRKEMNFKDIENNKLEFVFDVKISDLDKSYSVFILVDIDKNGKISVGDYISMERHEFVPRNNIPSLSIKVNKVES